MFGTGCAGIFPCSAFDSDQGRREDVRHRTTPIFDARGGIMRLVSALAVVVAALGLAMGAIGSDKHPVRTATSVSATAPGMIGCCDADAASTT
jgi:hypothetical protein